MMEDDGDKEGEAVELLQELYWMYDGRSNLLLMGERTGATKSSRYGPEARQPTD